MLHLDEARTKAISYLERRLASTPRGCKVVLIDDLFGKLRVVLWTRKKKDADLLRQDIDDELRRECHQYWTGIVWLAHGGGKVSEADRRMYNKAWDDATRIDGKLRILDRRRSRGTWFVQKDTPWEATQDGSNLDAPPIVVFYSFKGGVGRTTAVASFAIQRARQGERIVVIDADLDAPGLGSLLSGQDGGMASWGVVDYLLERPQGEVDLTDYYHVCSRENLTGPGEILVVPAGRIDSFYLGKLARLDLEPHQGEKLHPLDHLFRDVRKKLSPNWILVDARAGLADPAGMLLGGLAHLHVLLGTFSEQSWTGMRLVLQRLGRDRLHTGKPQADCLLVQAMVPENLEVAQRAHRSFEERSRDEFLDSYYAAESQSDDDPSDSYWRVGDAETSDAPHVPIPLRYSALLADFPSIDLVADDLAGSSPYRELATRIEKRFGV